MSSPETITAPRPARRLTIARAISEAIGQEMARDPAVLVMGEDIGKLGGVFGTTTGLLDKFGAERVRDTPISETAFIGAAVGLAASGMRPIVELMFVDFFGVCMDAIYNLAAKQSYFSGGQVTCPMVLMTSVGGGYGDAGQHSQTLYATFGHLPGLKVVIPSNAHDAKGLMLAAIRDPNPVIFLENEILYGKSFEVPAVDDFTIPFGKARIWREGSDVTIVSFGIGMTYALEAADKLAAEGISAEVIDLRTLRPIDYDTVLASVMKTNRCVTVEEGFPVGSIGNHISATIMQRAFDYLDAPVINCTGKDVPMPYAANLEKLALVTTAEVVDAVKSVCYR